MEEEKRGEKGGVEERGEGGRRGEKGEERREEGGGKVSGKERGWNREEIGKGRKHRGVEGKPSDATHHCTIYVRTYVLYSQMHSFTYKALKHLHSLTHTHTHTPPPPPPPSLTPAAVGW